MKTTLTFISTFLMMVSCLSHKTTQKAIDLSSEAQRVEVSYAEKRLYELQKQDTNRLLWLFRTDAPFSYHPDTGLRAQRGDLLLSIQSAHWQRILKDSSEMATYVTDREQFHKEQTTLSEKRPSSTKITWWTIGVLFVLSGAYLTRKKDR